MYSIWITWEDHRRSRELAEALGCRYEYLRYERSRILRYVVLLSRTTILVIRNKPTTVFCQNPSIILAAWLSLLRRPFGFTLVVDRHTNFNFGTEDSRNPKWLLFHFLSRFSLKHSDLTIVTNKPLARLVEKLGGRATVLQDKLPKIKTGAILKLNGRINFLFICTFSDDEPVHEVLTAFSRFPKDVFVYVTGKYHKFSEWKRFSGEANIIFLGFLREDDYQQYLGSCDATIVLTTQPMTLNCGSYESVVAEKPQIVANSEVIMDYFDAGAVYSGLTQKGIEVAIQTLIDNQDDLKTSVELLKRKLELDWRSRFERLVLELETLGTKRYNQSI